MSPSQPPIVYVKASHLLFQGHLRPRSSLLWGHPVPCRVFSSIPGLHPLDAGSTHQIRQSNMCLKVPSAKLSQPFCLDSLSWLYPPSKAPSQEPLNLSIFHHHEYIYYRLCLELYSINKPKHLFFLRQELSHNMKQRLPPLSREFASSLQPRDCVHLLTATAAP